jgi:hypothetical protein
MCTTSAFGTVQRLNEAFAEATVLLEDGTTATFHSTSFHSGTPFRLPRQGESVEMVFVLARGETCLSIVKPATKKRDVSPNTR